MTQLQAYFGDTGVLKKAFCNVSVWTWRKNRMMASREVKVALAIVAAVAVAFAAYQAESVFAPLVLALFVIGISWPLQQALQSRMPKLVALAITLIVIVAVGLAFGSLIAWGFGRVGRALVSDAARYIRRFTTAWWPGSTATAFRWPGSGPSISMSAGSWARRSISPVASIRPWRSG